MISIVLVEPENPDNIGAVARAMKNMGLSSLRLVKPPKGWKAKGKKLAMSAEDVLVSARVFLTVEKAVAQSRLVVGTTRRAGPRRGEFLTFEKAIQKIKIMARSKEVSLLFGKESKGLDNETIEKCDWMIHIPSSDLYPSLNLAQAVMVIAFSLFQERFKEQETLPKRELRFCNKREIEETLEHFRTGLQALDYHQGKGLLGRVLTTVRGIFKRNGMLAEESQMLKGLSRTIRYKLEKSGVKHPERDTI